MLSKNDIKIIKSLQNKKFRKLYSLFTVEGEKNVLELMQAKWPVDKLLITADFASKHGNLLIPYTRKKIEVSETLLRELGYLESNTAALAVVPMIDRKEEEPDASASMLVLCNVQDPGNLGTIMRTADWFGIGQIVCSSSTVEWFNPKVIQATMGAFTRVKVYYKDLSHFLQGLNMPVVAADLEGKNIREFEFPKPVALMMGSESHGIPDNLSSFITDKVTIPAIGGSESLNVAVAAGILCYEAGGGQ